MDLFKHDLAAANQTFDLSFLSKGSSEPADFSDELVSEDFAMTQLAAPLPSFDTTSSQKVIDEASRFLKGSGLNFSQNKIAADVFTGSLNSKEKNYYAVTSLREAEFRLGW